MGLVTDQCDQEALRRFFGSVLVSAGKARDYWARSLERQNRLAERRRAAPLPQVNISEFDVHEERGKVERH
jgi:hypothetical protein